MAGISQDPRIDTSKIVKVIGQPIKVVVGAIEQVFYVHQGLLEQSSDFFKAALGKNWKEGEDRAVSLPEDDGEIFDIYVQWLYTHRIVLSLENQDPGKQDRHYHRLARLFVLGEKLLDRRFQDTVLTAVVYECRLVDEVPNADGNSQFYPSSDAITILYEGTSTGSCARKLMVDLYLTQGVAKWMTKFEDESWPPEFLFDLTTALFAKRTLPFAIKREYDELEKGSPCSYHNHGKNEACTVTVQWT